MTYPESPPSAPSAADASPALRSALSDSRVAVIVSFALLAVGVGVRAYHYVDQRSLWLDEVWHALNIVARSFPGLVRPLDYEQLAPVAFLWTERLAVVIGGANELALRAFPLLAGCVLLIALWLLARRLLDVRAAALCLGVAVVSPLLVYYSNEVKSYISDALVTVILIWLALDVLDAPDTPRAWRRLATGGVVAILFSTPSLFVLAGVGVALAAHPTIRGSRAGWLRLLGSSVLWVSVYGTLYLTIYRSTATGDHMQTIWSSTFLSLPPSKLLNDGLLATRSLWIEALFAETDAALPRKTITTVALLSAIGIIALARRRGLSVTLLLLVPFVAAGAASFARLWPLSPRLLVFLVPIVVLFPVAGMVAAADILPVRARGLALTAMGVLFLASGAATGVARLKEPRRRDDVAPLIKDFWPLRTSGNALMYVVGHAAPSWLFYSLPWDRRAAPVVRNAIALANFAARSPVRSCLQQDPRLRTVFSGMGPGATTDSALAAEAAWLSAQPAREVWLLTISYEHEVGHKLDAQLRARGAEQTLERSRNGAEIRRYRLPPADTSRISARCGAES